ncbi:MAG: transcriptional regulator MntR [Proteobacteria bacterium]|nr:MAG: transcriptional regulator MntR [Pseudomonadota bacterium]
MSPNKAKKQGQLDLVAPEIQARWFAQVRKAHQNETTEDYVELIADLIEHHQEARASELAARLGVTNPTVTKMLTRLQNCGYIKSEPYRSIFLTQKGKELAKSCKRRHQIVLDFLIRLGVEPEIAEFDAEGIEHHISEATLKAMENFKS